MWWWVEYVGSFGHDITWLFPVVMTEFRESHLKHSYQTDWQLLARLLATFSLFVAYKLWLPRHSPPKYKMSLETVVV